MLKSLIFILIDGKRAWIYDADRFPVLLEYVLGGKRSPGINIHFEEIIDHHSFIVRHDYFPYIIVGIEIVEQKARFRFF